jgi:undecaprenyl-diphosphatase
LLGLVQGLTEFLPVSSSGHLVLGQALLGIHQQGIVFEIFVHFGTLIAVVTIFWSDVVGLVKAFFRFRWVRPSRLAVSSSNPGHDRLLLFVILGTLPVVVVGLFFGDTLESTFGRPRFAAAMLLVTGALLLASRWAQSALGGLTSTRAASVGVSQVLAMLPGISRSGTTITAAMFLGVNRNEAVRFSFLLAIPAIAGATLLKSIELFRTPPTAAEGLALAVGTVTAYLSGLVAIRWLLAVVRKGHLDWFGYYCIALGGVALLVLA